MTTSPSIGLQPVPIDASQVAVAIQAVQDAIGHPICAGAFEAIRQRLALLFPEADRGALVRGLQQ